MYSEFRIVESRKVEGLGEILVASMRGLESHLVEFVDTRDPRYPVDEKWVTILSTQFGCPVGCLFCDAGGMFQGNLMTGEMLALLDYLVERRFPDRRVPVPKWKLHFARMGEPALNPSVLEVLEMLPERFDAPGLIPTIPTIAPGNSWEWFERLLEIKNRLYPGGRFQVQFSVNSTDESFRDRIMPYPKWSMTEIAEFGKRWFSPGDRKLTLNFALGPEIPFDPAKAAETFDPARFLVKFTPVNRTEAARKNGIETLLDHERTEGAAGHISSLQEAGFEVILSIGEAEEIELGTNCGQAVSRIRRERAYRAANRG